MNHIVPDPIIEGGYDLILCDFSIRCIANIVKFPVYSIANILGTLNADDRNSHLLGVLLMNFRKAGIDLTIMPSRLESRTHGNSLKVRRWS
jgi:hypothetical protein